MRPFATIVAVFLAPILAAGCGGRETPPRLAWSQDTLTLSASGSATVRLQVQPGSTLPLPAGDWLACISVGGGPSAAPPSGYTGTPTPRLPQCVTFAAGQLSADIAISGAAAEALAGTWWLRAEGSGELEGSQYLTVTQTVP